MTILADNQFLYGLWFNDQEHFAEHYKLDQVVSGISSQAERAINWLDQYFAGQKPSLQGLHFKAQVTPFQKKVYQTLLTIPYGKTISYQEIANKLENHHKSRGMARAVGNAVARNQILLMIPCHRVVASNGALTGYAGGLDRKKALLELEGLDIFNYK